MLKIQNFIDCILVLLTVSSCGGTNNQFVSKDPLVLKYFTLDEANELQSIHDFFVDHVCSSEKGINADAATCLTVFMQDNKMAALSGGSIDIHISHEEEIEVLEGLSPTLFAEIWYVDQEFGYLNHYFLHNYMNMMARMGQDNSLIEKYYNELVFTTGGVNAAASSLILMQPDELDMTDCKQRLLIAIHYFTWNYNNHIAELHYGEI